MADFTLSRSTVVDAPPERVHLLLDDFRKWRGWSPWEEVDPDLQRTYAGADSGVGAHYEWSGNAKAGKGAMEVTESTPHRVVVDLRFLKPFKARNTTTFDLVPNGSGTDVTWTMTGRRGALMSLMGRLFVDQSIAKDFDRGLARLKALAES